MPPVQKTAAFLLRDRQHPPAPPQQAGLRAAVVRAPLPGPPAGSGRVHSAGGGGFHRPPARPRITRLRRQGERYFADGLRELPENRRLAILAVCAVEWEMFLADAVVATHDRIVGRTHRTAVRTCEAQLGDETAAVREALRSLTALGNALLGARDAARAVAVAGAGRGSAEAGRRGASRRDRGRQHRRWHAPHRKDRSRRVECSRSNRHR